MSKVSMAEWSQWMNSPVTKLVHAHLSESQHDAINKMLNINAADKPLEVVGSQYLAARYYVDGVAQFTDLEGLASILVDEATHEKS
jgi:hypothetical protein